MNERRVRWKWKWEWEWDEMRTEVVKSNTTMPTETKLATPKNNKEIHNELLSM